MVHLFWYIIINIIIYFYSRSDEVIANHAESECDTEEQQLQYAVQFILDKRLNNNKVEYYIKWHGYNDRDSTWEPQENLQCDELMKQFDDRLIQSEKKRKRTEKFESRRKRRLEEMANNVSETAQVEKIPEHKLN